MLLGTRPLNIAPLASTYNGVTYEVVSPLYVEWGIRQYVTSSLDTTWEILSYVSSELYVSWDLENTVRMYLDVSFSIQSYVESPLEITWGIVSEVTASLDIFWDLESYVEKPLTTSWNIAHRVEVTTANRYCLAPVNRVKVLDCLTNTCEDTNEN